MRAVLLVMAVVLLIPVLNFALYSRPSRLQLVDVALAPAVPDSTIQFLVRECPSTTTGHLWWKTLTVDHKACLNAPVTYQTTGQFTAPNQYPAYRVQFTWLCIGCSYTPLTKFKIWQGGPSPEAMPESPYIDLATRLNDNNMVQVAYTVRSPGAILQPEIQ